MKNIINYMLTALLILAVQFNGIAQSMGRTTLGSIDFSFRNTNKLQLTPTTNLFALTNNNYSSPKINPMADGEDPTKKEPMNTFWMGAGVGFGIGAIGGVILGLTGKDWVLPDGRIIGRFPHAVVDAFIVGAPFTIIGGLVGVRKPKSTLKPSKWHIGIAGGWQSVMTYNDIIAGYENSGMPATIPHWFGYLHYPNGENSSVPYTWNLSADYNFHPKLLLGIALNNFVRQEVKSGQNHHVATFPLVDSPHEYVKGKTVSLLWGYILNPITPDSWGRLQYSTGVGVGMSFIEAGGRLESEYSAYKVKEMVATPHVRAAIDYFSRPNLSMQLKFDYKFKQTIDIPTQIDVTPYVNVLQAHSINLRSVDITLGVIYHFGE